MGFANSVREPKFSKIERNARHSHSFLKHLVKRTHIVRYVVFEKSWCCVKTATTRTTPQKIYQPLYNDLKPKASEFTTSNFLSHSFRMSKNTSKNVACDYSVSSQTSLESDLSGTRDFKTRSLEHMDDDELERILRRQYKKVHALDCNIYCNVVQSQNLTAGRFSMPLRNLWPRHVKSKCHLCQRVSRSPQHTSKRPRRAAVRSSLGAKTHQPCSTFISDCTDTIS